MTKLEEGCPFCKRIDEGNIEGETSKGAVRFEPLNPVTEGHMLFIPMEHVLHGTQEGGEGLEAAISYANWWGAWTQTESWNLITSNGHFATQTVPHIHVHFVPRTQDDGLQLPWGLPHEEKDELAPVRESLALAKALYDQYDGDVTLGHLVEGLEQTIAEAE
ncbi:histidine triad nucleotide binding protein [Microbacterium phage PauloDiaboli]|nr:histidine triad nucleotide binding protein [Microbacterium phage PauloDiaboli]QWY83893.1 histidine triad nucleotide binding protein [Microbacterium phage A3Wally]